jgi:hypothetical protein
VFALKKHAPLVWPTHPTIISQRENGITKATHTLSEANPFLNCFLVVKVCKVSADTAEASPAVCCFLLSPIPSHVPSRSTTPRWSDCAGTISLNSNPEHAIPEPDLSTCANKAFAYSVSRSDSGLPFENKNKRKQRPSKDCPLPHAVYRSRLARTQIVDTAVPSRGPLKQPRAGNTRQIAIGLEPGSELRRRNVRQPTVYQSRFYIGRCDGTSSEGSEHSLEIFTARAAALCQSSRRNGHSSVRSNPENAGANAGDTHRPLGTHLCPAGSQLVINGDRNKTPLRSPSLCKEVWHGGLEDWNRVHARVTQSGREPAANACAAVHVGRVGH